ncbi:protein Shroom, partial [Hetaerina americana]|uniref:protein Shroom n=1 Tax=Hetaerina americana TaxID=62018 RepID=UPI003A7F4E71
PDSPPPSSLSSSPVRSPPYPFPLPRVDRDGKPIGDSDYAVPSPPERDTGGWSNRGGTRLTQADLEEYARTYEESLVPSSASSSSYAHSEGYHSYVSSCDSSASASHTPFLDRLRRESEATAAAAAAAAAASQQQRSALSSLGAGGECHKQSDGRGVAADDADDETEDAGVADEDDHHESSDSVCDEGSGSRLAHGGGGGGSGGSSSGGETLKWHGSVGDVSVASSSVSGSSSSAAARQLIAHSARVKTPQRHHSESVLYLGGGPMASSASTTSGSSSSTSWQARVQRNNALNHKLRMFPVNTYTVQPQLQMATVHHQQQQSQQQPVSPSSPPPADQTSPRTMLRLPHSFSVAERIHELEKQSRRRTGAEGSSWNGNNVNNNGGGYTYLDPEKRHRVSDPTLKAIQKKALLSYYERHHRGGGRASSGNPSPDGGVMGVARLTCVPGMASSTNSEDGMTKHSEGNGIICSSNGTWRSEQQQAQPQVPTSSQQHHQQVSPTQRSLSPQHQYAPQSPRSSSCQQKEGHSQPYHRSQSMDGKPSPPSEPPPNEDDASVSLTLPQSRGLPQNCAPVPYSRRSSSASDYLSAGGTWREHFQRGREAAAASSDAGSVRDMPRHEHSASCGSLPGGELGPLILGPPISLDHWVPERPPKKPHLRAAFSPPHQLQSPPQSFPHTPNEISDTPPSSPPIPPPRTTSSSNSSPASAPPILPSSAHRCPSPDDPPPPPPPPLPEDDEVVLSDEPLPPPPPHLQPPSPQSHDSWLMPHGSRKSPTSCPPLTLETQPEGCARSNGVSHPTSVPYIAPERHFFGENFNPSPSISMTKSCSPPPRPQQLHPWQPMGSGGDGGSSLCHSNHSQSTVQQLSPNVPLRGVPAVRTLVKSPNQGFATSKSIVPGGGRERPPVMSRARANASQHWRSTDSSSESSRTSPKSPPLSANLLHEGPIPGPQSPVKELKSSDRDWISSLGSQAHRRPNHWQVPLKSTVRKFPSEHLSPSKNSIESIQIKSPSRSLQAMNLKNSDSDDNRHSHSHENGTGDRLIGERCVEGVEENIDVNTLKTKSGKFQANLVGKAALRTQSKSSSYLSTYHTHHLQLMHRRGSEKGTPNFEGSYKRTLSPPSSELLHLSKQPDTLQQCGLTESNSESKNQHHQHVPGWEERVPDMAGGTLGSLNNPKDICETVGMKGGRRSRLDHSWVKSEASWRDETGITERRLDEEDGTSEMDEGEEDGERIRRGRRRRGINGRENGSAVLAGSQSRSLTASSSSSSSSTMSSFSVSSMSTSSLPGMSSLRSPMSLAPYEASADSWVISQSSPPTQTAENDQSVSSSGKADAASQTESLDEGVEVERRDLGGEEKGSLEEMEAKKERVLPEAGFARNTLVKRSSSEGMNGAIENGTHAPATPPPSSPPPSPPKCSPPANSPPQLSVPPKPVPVVPPPPTSQSLTEEAECERLSRDLVSLLPPTDRLQGILAPIPDQKRPTDYVSGLFRLDVAPRPRSSTSASVNRLLGSKSSKSNEEESHDSNTEELSKVESRCKTNSEAVKKERIEAPLPATSPYFTTSEPKARFLARYGRDVGSGRTGLEQTDTQELQRKKEELMSRLSRKLEVLREEAIAVNEEAALNEDLGKGVANQLGQLALPHELSRFKLHVDEVGKVTSLLLALSGRLARAENALALEDTASPSNGHLKSSLSSGEERKALEGKRDKLRDQLEEAKQLKASIDRRSGSVSAMLARYLDPEAFADYGHFISMKAKLIVDAREVSDKIKLGEEQLSALRETLLSSSFPTSTTNTICQSNAISSTSVEITSSPSSVPEKSTTIYSGSTIVSHNPAPLTAGSN